MREREDTRTRSVHQGLAGDGVPSDLPGRKMIRIPGEGVIRIPGTRELRVGGLRVT
jgi:hypothetical protein